MSLSVSPSSPLLRLPRELRDQIYTYAFDDSEFFLKNRAAITTPSKIALFHDLPALCQAIRQLFNEATPIFLAQNLFSWNTQESKQVLDLYSHLPKDAASERVKHISIHNWTEQGTSTHLELISKFTQLESVKLIFSFPSIEDGVRMERLDYTSEQECYLENGLHYDLPEGRSLEQEKASLVQDVETFVAKYGLDRIIDLPSSTACNSYSQRTRMACMHLAATKSIGIACAIRCGGGRRKSWRRNGELISFPSRLRCRRIVIM
jgi:hypothetical protein